MKNNKKVFNYLLVLCASFIISLCYVNAATVNKIPLEPGNTMTLSSNYYHTSCENPDSKHFTITVKNGQARVSYDTYNAGLELYEFNCTGYKIGGKAENLNLPYTINVSGKIIETAENGVIERTVPVNAGQKTSLNDYCKNKNNCKIEIIDNASGTLSVDGTTIKINRSNISKVVQGKALLTYEEKGVTNKTTLEITVPDEFGGAIIYPGDTNLCKIDTSVWKAKDWLDDSNHHHSYYQAKGNATFPTCSGDNSVYPMEFKGWVPTEQNKNITNLNESCSGMVSGTTADSTGSYFACYEAKPTIQIATEANVSNPQDWKKVTGMGYYYVGNNKKEVKLPQLSFIGFNKKKELDYWESDKGEHKQSGDTVPLDGSVWKAVVKTSSTIDIRGYERNIYIGKVAVFSSVTDKITSCGSNSPGIVEAKFVNGECQVTGLKDTNGEFSAKVFAITDKGETINYNVKVTGYSSGQNGNAAFEVDLSNNVDFKVVNPPSKVIKEDKNKDSTSTSLGTSTVKTTCTQFKFSWNNSTSGNFTDYFHISNRVGYSHKFHAYCLPNSGQFNVDGSGNPSGDYAEYDALCLEEYQAAPNIDYMNINLNPIYRPEYDSLDKLEGYSYLIFVLDYIVKNYYYYDDGKPTGFLNSGQNPKFVTAQILTRLAWSAEKKATTKFYWVEGTKNCKNNPAYYKENKEYCDFLKDKNYDTQGYFHNTYEDVADYFFDVTITDKTSSKWLNNVIGKEGECSSSDGNDCIIAEKNPNNWQLDGTGLGLRSKDGKSKGATYEAIIDELWRVHWAYVQAGGKDGLANYSNTMNGDGFVGNDVPEKSSDGERNPKYETNETNTYSVTYEGSILVTAKFENRKVTLDTSSCNWTGVVCEVIQQPTYSGEKDKDNNLMFKYKVKLTVTDAANVKVPETAAEKDKVSFKVLVDGKNISFNDAFILEAKESDTRELNQYQRMLVFRPDATDEEAKLYFPFLLIPTKCTAVPATNFENYGNPEFNESLFLASNCCKDVTNDVENQELLEQVCQNRCTTSTFTNVCRWDTKHEADSELYLIKEGTIYKNGKYENQIGACIADVDHDYSDDVTKHFFEKTDDNDNSINIADYKNNRYCQVTCKEDWSISMDSFGNYVGVNAIAAGSSFAINNDIFISGERTCYSSYINTDKYMNDIVKISNTIVQEYNKYSNNSHSYTEISKLTGADIKAEASEPLCAVWRNAPSGYSDGDYSGGYFTQTKNANPDGSCPTTTGLKDYSGNAVNGRLEGTKCYYSVAIQCETYGKYYSYELESGKDKTYAHYETQIKSTVAGAFGGNNIAVENSTTSKDVSYARTDKIGCEYVERKGPGSKNILNCSYGSSDITSNDGSPTISGEATSYCASYVSDTDFCILSSAPDIPKAVRAIKATAMIAVSGAATDAQKEMSKLYKEVEESTKDLYQCQNFYLYNVEASDDKGQRFDVGYNPLGIGADEVRIDTAFKPTASYKYDEAAFMTLLGNDNVIEEYQSKNESIMSDYYSSSPKERSVDAEIIAYDKYGKDYSVSGVKLQRNNTKITYYNDPPWKKGSPSYNNYIGTDEKTSNDYEIKNVTFCTAGDLADTYSNPKVDENEDYTQLFTGVANSDKKEDPLIWSKGQCYTVKVKYRKAHYVSAYIGNSSFYHNKGNWYMNTATDIKEHGDNLDAAIDNANARSSSLLYKKDDNSKSQWTLMYGDTQNVFPVSLTTPRNLYQYTYAFKDIGYFNNNKLGRIMGSENSIYTSNARTCFYEIYEDVCLCCGSKITTHVDNEVPADLIGKMEQIGGGKGNYSYNSSNADALQNGSSGTLKIIPSTIGLGDVASQYGNNSATVPTNWSDKSSFTYNGAKYYTNKGSLALNQIESQGEHIYANTAEYSYYLTPNTLAAIREYNDVNGYEINANNLRVVADNGIYGYAINATNDNGVIKSSDGDRENYVMFQHYGSKFLENQMWEYNAVLSNTLAQKKNNKICYVDQNNVGNINDMVKDGCRWVDYIQPNQPANSQDKRNENIPFRLAFK